MESGTSAPELQRSWIRRARGGAGLVSAASPAGRRRAARDYSSLGSCSGGDEGGVVIALGDWRQAADDLVPALAAVVAAPHLTGGGRGEEREGRAPVFQAHRLEGGPQTVGQPAVQQHLPGLAAVGAPGDARARVVLATPEPGSLLGGCHAHQLGLTRQEHQWIGLAEDLVL